MIRGNIEKDIPGLSPRYIRFYFSDLQEVWPAAPLSKKDRAALKSAGYEWYGNHWQKPFYNDGVESELKINKKPVGSMVNATHWAETPSGDILHYRIERGKVILWRPYSKVWDVTEDAPYTLHIFPFKE